MEKLRLEAKEQEYRRLINPTPQYSTLYDKKLEDYDLAPTPQQALKELKNQLTTIINVLLVLVVYHMPFGIGQKLHGDYQLVIEHY